MIVGRDSDIERLQNALGAARGLVTVVGPAGVGKSALASAIAQDARLVRVDLAGAGDASEIERRLGRALGIGRSKATDLLERVAARLDKDSSRLWLDDVDATGEAAKVVAQLLTRAPSSAAIATARSMLGVENEQRFELAPLSVENGARLFRERMRGREDATDATVRAIVERLDGLPLAIVLAAGRTAVLAPEEILSRLDEPLRVLRGSGAESRHATVSAALESSWRDLPEASRTALGYAAMFEGAFAAEAFEAVTADTLAGDPLDLLEGLLSLSLLERAHRPGAVRFRMLHVVRAFVREQHQSADATDSKGRNVDVRPLHVDDAASARYATTVLQQAEHAAHRTYGARAESALHELADLLPDVLAAMHATEAARPEVAAALWLTLFDPILFRDVLPLDDARFSQAIVAADRTTSPTLRARTRILRARALMELGPPATAENDLRFALAIAEAPESGAVGPQLAAEARRSLGWLELGRGQVAAALAELELALATCVAVRDPRGHADALAAIGMAEHLSGQSARGNEALDLAHALHVGQKDELRAARVDEMRALVGGTAASTVTKTLAAVTESAARHEKAGQSWRLAVDLALMAQLEEAAGATHRARDLRLRARAAARSADMKVLEDAVARVPTEATTAAPNSVQTAQFKVGPDARSLELPDGTHVDLTRHGALRLVMRALVDARVDRPGEALSASDLLAAGWPGERVLHEAGMLRVYSMVRRLRRLGFEQVLITRDDGYLLDPAVTITRA